MMRAQQGLSWHSTHNAITAHDEGQKGLSWHSTGNAITAHYDHECKPTRHLSDWDLWTWQMLGARPWSGHRRAIGPYRLGCAWRVRQYSAAHLLCHRPEFLNPRSTRQLLTAHTNRVKYFLLATNMAGGGGGGMQRNNIQKFTAGEFHGKG
jgi:hypothetical protein